MNLNTVMNIGYIISLLVILVATILILRQWSGPGSGLEVSPLAYSLLLLGMVGLTGTAPIFMVTHLGLGKLLGITGDEKTSE